MKYAEQLKDPRWQRKRLEVLQAKQFKCESCENETETLHVHHRYYVSHRMPWEYPDFCYQVLCASCHEQEKLNIEENRQRGFCMYDLWEHGLDHFGKEIFDMAAKEMISS